MRTAAQEAFLEVHFRQRAQLEEEGQAEHWGPCRTRVEALVESALWKDIFSTTFACHRLSTPDC